MRCEGGEEGKTNGASSGAEGVCESGEHLESVESASSGANSSGERRRDGESNFIIDHDRQLGHSLL